MSKHLQAPSGGFDSVKMPNGTVYKVRDGIVEVHEDHLSAFINMGFRFAAEVATPAPEVGRTLPSEPPAAKPSTPAPAAKSSK